MAAGLVVGVMGQAPLPDPRATRAILADLVEGRNVHFILSLHYPLSDAVTTTWQFLSETDLETATYDVVLDETTPEDDDEVNAILAGAAKRHSVLRATNKLTNLLGEAIDAGVEAVLYCGYVNDDPAEMTEAGKESYHALKRCSQRSIPLFDIADGEQWEPLSEEEIRNGPQVPVEAPDNLPEGEDGEEDGEDAEEPEEDPEEEVVIDLSEVPEDPSVWKVRAAREYLKEHRVFTGEERRGAENRWKRRVGAMNLKTALDWLYPKQEEDTQLLSLGWLGDVMEAVDPDNIVTMRDPKVLETLPSDLPEREDTIVGWPRAEMEQYAKDREYLLKGHPPVPPTTVDLHLVVDLRAVVRQAIEGDTTVNQIMLELVAEALK